MYMAAHMVSLKTGVSSRGLPFLLPLANATLGQGNVIPEGRKPYPGS